MNRQVILVTDEFSAASLTQLQLESEWEVRFSQFPTPTDVELKGATALLIRSRTKVNKELIEKAPQLKVVVTATSGYDHIDLEGCRQHQIAVMHTPQANAQSAAELTLLLMLALSRQLPLVFSSMKESGWRNGVPRGNLLHGQNLGIVGLGRIGSLVAKMAQAFGMKVSACDPFIDDHVFSSLNVERLGFSELLISSDFVSLHVPLTEQTRHMINAQTIELMPSHGRLINTSRGEVVDENALIAALMNQQLAGAGLDVFENEPLARECRLRGLKNVVLTPHIGAYTEDAWQQASSQAVRQLLDFFKTGSLSNAL